MALPYLLSKKYRAKVDMRIGGDDAAGDEDAGGGLLADDHVSDMRLARWQAIRKVHFVLQVFEVEDGPFWEQSDTARSQQHLHESQGQARRQDNQPEAHPSIAVQHHTRRSGWHT